MAYERTTANRSGKITIELHDNFTASGFVDGECVVARVTIFQKLTPRTLVKNHWDVEETKETYVKKYKNGLGETINKKNVLYNPMKEFSKAYTVTPSQFCKVFNSAIWKSAIVPYKEFQTLFFGKKSVNKGAFVQVVKTHDLLTQALQDGQKNILPFIQQSAMTPQELKKHYGKGLWKKVCQNTLGRNKLLFSRTHLVDLDSGALKHPQPKAAHWVKNVCGIPYTKMKVEGREFTDLFTDTERMARREGYPFNPTWSKLKMQEKHSEYMTVAQRDAETRRRERDEEYRLRMEKFEKVDLSKVYPQTVFEKDGVVATILSTYSQIRQEGEVMRHCVGSYAEESVNGTYAVIHMSGDDEETTLGLIVYRNPWGEDVSSDFQFNQHYGKYNSPVVSEKHKAMVDVVVQYLNGLKLTKESYEQK